MSKLYMGILSGTSADGIDAALVDFEAKQPVIVGTHFVPFTETLRETIFSLYQSGENEIVRLAKLDVELGKMFADAAKQLIKKYDLSSRDVRAIGSHGQNIRHCPDTSNRFTLQIGDPNIIAAETGITTVADFRRRDMALGGQGAPLVPAFHHFILSSTAIDRAIVNIGGIANVTLLPKKLTSLSGFDTGPGNALLDAWIHLHQKKSHDQHGEWGAQGEIHSALLTALLADPYFTKTAPKSTGREYFNLTWLNTYLTLFKTIAPVDVQATLVELTAISIADAIKSYLLQGEVLVCGGGAHNAFLMNRLQNSLQPPFTVDSTQQYGIDPDWVEAMTFAWLAKQTLHHQPGNVPSVTGAKEATVLGGVYFANPTLPI